MNNNNNFCVYGTDSTHKLTLQHCSATGPAKVAQSFVAEADLSIRHSGSCLDVDNCEKTDGAVVAVYPW